MNAALAVDDLRTSASQRDGVVPVALVTLAVVVVHNIVHEGGHAIAAKALGYDVVARMNHLDIVGGTYASQAHAALVSAAGLLVTILVAICAFLSARRWPLALTVVASALAMRIVAAVVSLWYPNDEARISLALGLGQWAIFAAVIALLAGLFSILHRRSPQGWHWWLGSYIGASIGFAFTVLGEPYLPALHF